MRGGTPLKKYFLTLFILVITLIGCSQSEDSNKVLHSEGVDNTLEGLAFNMETKQYSPMMASFLEQVNDPKVEEAYDIAIHHPEVLDFMPCYCGCYDEAGHENNTHCFVSGVHDGVAQLDNMGLG